MLRNSPISWKTKKQASVSRSSVETEYEAVAMITSELLWVRSFLASLGIFHARPMILSCDNQAAFHIAWNPILHKRTKHIELDYHFVLEKLDAILLQFSYIGSQHQAADIFTKALKKKQFEHLSNKLGMYNLHAPTWGGVLRN